MVPADAAPAMVRISVCYAKPDSVFLKELDVPAGTTIAAAIVGSGLQQACPEVDPSTMRVGIYGKLKTPDTVVRAGDRVEVYRPLTADPKTARRRRVQKTRESGTREGQKWLRGGG
ncbi:RnfH family protein [Cupriavidus sp. WKF15]|uniref:RnfH family protein n=1 Tax=Cupriavidus sp. WKF15 TaxID=3032282 RepID=UPI0023E3152E|nr:RnfH family protein [Cupriavidus sp. WKF15]WER47400.1 RnfH family protein [Cupriavidus sp. WKF15]